MTKRGTGNRQKKIVQARFARGGGRLPRPSPSRPARVRRPPARRGPAVTVRPATRENASGWLALRRALWPDGSEKEHRAEIEEFLTGRSRQLADVRIAVDPQGSAVGFAELSIRSYAEGCRSDRVAFLEGWYVTPAGRGRGIGRALVEAAERWARTQGCTEFASDREADNTGVGGAHLSLGFEEVGSVVCYRKDL